VAGKPEVVADFAWRHEAEFALETLRAAGIQAVLVADDAGGALPGLSLSGRVRILAESSEVEQARAILGEAGDPGGLAG
jgi:hypothetical protein